MLYVEIEEAPAATPRPSGDELERATLATGTLLNIDVSDACGLSIACEAGTLWITQEGCSDDILLKPGERFRTRRAGRVLIESLGTAATIGVRRLRSEREQRATAA